MPTSKSQQKAVAKYMKANYEEIKVRIPKGKKQIIQNYAKANNISVNKLFWHLICKELNTTERK